MITFQYVNPDTSSAAGKQPQYRSLNLRVDPYEVQWTYNVNTAQYDTYGGQVIQVLSVNIDTLTISGQLGREGAFGVYRASGPQKDDRYGGPVPTGGYVNKYIDRQFEYQNAEFPGLHAMVEYFREYFAVVSQGGDPQNPGRYQQIPMTCVYGGGPSHEMRTWILTPTEFPNFRRANDNFAPEWKINAQVIEADATILANQKDAAINRLRSAIGYQIRNPFSDPLADPSTDITSINNQIASQFKVILPQFSKGELADMIWQNISVPSTAASSQPDQAVDPSEYLQGEIGVSSSNSTYNGPH